MVDPSETLTAFVSDLERNGAFKYESSDTTAYKGLEKMRWTIKVEIFQNASTYPENSKFYTMVEGTQNLSTCLNAPILATKGHYFMFSELWKSQNTTAI
jgi:hypothetical protein